MSEKWIGRLAGALTVLVLFSGWRPMRVVSPIPVLRSNAKGPRRCVTEIPETSVGRLRDGERRAPGREALAGSPSRDRAAAPGPLAFASESVRGRLAHVLARPRYLQAYLPRDAQNAVAPPLA